MLLLQDYIFDKRLVTLVGYIQPVSTYTNYNMTVFMYVM